MINECSIVAQLAGAGIGIFAIGALVTVIYGDIKFRQNMKKQEEIWAEERKALFEKLMQITKKSYKVD